MLYFFFCALLLPCGSTFSVSSSVSIYDKVKNLNRNIQSDSKVQYIKPTIPERTKIVKNKLSGTNQDNLQCSGCRTLLKLALWKFRTENYTYPGLPEFIDNYCKTLHIEENVVCDGLIELFKTEALTLLTDLRLTANDVCGLILPTTCYSPTLSWNKIKWNVSLPEHILYKYQENKTRHTGKVYRVLHLTDPHIDFDYLPGSEVNCDEPLCCQSNSKISKKLHQPAGYWGSLGYCDTPYWTFENLLKFASKKEKYDFILWTGDLPSHNDWNQSQEKQLNIIKNTTAALLKYFPNTPILPALGNHESTPVNSFPPTYVHGNNSIKWLYDALNSAWSNWLPKSALETVKKYGYYSSLIKSNLRIVSLNMNYCNQQNWWMLINPVDPNNELSWLVSTLTVAETRSESVLIIGHIPPGYGPDCLRIWSANYYKIIQRFYQTIKGQFFGHTHSDEMELFYNESSLTTAISVAYVTPSVTTYHGKNPAYRVFSIDNNYHEVVDFETYLLNLTKANANKTSAPLWQLEYSAKTSYNLTDLSPASWNVLLQSWILYKDPVAINSFDRYYQHLYAGNPPNKLCDKECRKILLCNIRSGKSDDRSELCKNIL